MKYFISAKDRLRIERISKQNYPLEICGVLGYRAANRNILITPLLVENKAKNRMAHFKIKREDFLAAKRNLLKEKLKYGGIFHSHPSTFAMPTTNDRNHNMGNSIWLIYSVCYQELRLFHWSGKRFTELKLKTI